MKKIAVISLENINNIGDELLGENIEFLIRKIDVKFSIFKIELFIDKYKLIRKYILNIIIAKIFFLASDLLPISDMKYIVKNWGFIIKYKLYFERNIKKADIVVYAVGMLKYSTQDFSYVFMLINSIAEKYKIPVLMSAMSIETPNTSDWRYRQLVRAVNCTSVKCITTRDNEEELEVLNKNYLDKKILIDNCVVGDPALWTPDCYSVSRWDISKNDVIGIGLIRLGIYKDYGYSIDEIKLFDFYRKLIEELEKRNLKWKLFCNGMEEDYEVGIRLINELGVSRMKLLPRPENSMELIKLLSEFRCVLGARLHSCIISYTFNIPVVGLIWDNKLRAFAKKIDWEEYFIEPEKLDARLVVEKLLNVSTEKYDSNLYQNLRMSTFENIKKFVKTNI